MSEAQPLAADLDAIWMILCAVLVLLMQGGFACLESGMVRAKNSTNVAVKNMVDICIAGIAFWAVGYGLMFGDSLGGWLGGSSFFFTESATRDQAFFFFQLVFCGTAVTIVSGAVAERMKFTGYMGVSVLMSLAIYPVIGHWVWAEHGWLAQLGFVDFAGSTVVHSVGGWLALVAVIVIGPRVGRFGENGRPIEGHDLALSSLGVMLLWVGWFGFNAGSTLSLNNAVPGIVLNTALAPLAGGLAAMAMFWWFRGQPRPDGLMNGILAGLVGITANCHAVSPGEAILIGAVAGGCYVVGDAVLLRLRIDDAVGAVPTHLVAGIWGTLAVALFGDPEVLGTGLGRWEQLQVQALGIAAAAAFATGVGLPVLWTWHRLRPLRVEAADEQIGLNVAEHGASNALLTLLQEMESQRQAGDFSRSVQVEHQTEAGLIAAQYNAVLRKVRSEALRRERAVARMEQAKEAAERASQAKSHFLASMSHELRTPLNAVLGFSEMMRKEAFGPVGNARYRGYIDDIHSSAKHLLSMINDLLDLSKVEANRYELQESEIEVADALQRSIKLTQSLTESHGQTVTLEASPELPRLYADARVLRQIMLNLLSNASKFTPEGGTISVAAELEGDGRLAIRVRDTGVGMTREELRRALQPFTQVQAEQNSHIAAAEQRGTGLGLPLTKSLVELHGGSMVVASTPEEGTVVTVRFPVERILLRSPQVA